MRHSLVTIALLNQARDAANAFAAEDAAAEADRELSPAAAKLMAALEPRPRRFAGRRARRARARTLSRRA